MFKNIRVYILYLLAISIVLLGVRPLIYSLAKIPVCASWSMNAEEEEENKKENKGEEGEEKITCLSVNYSFTESEQHFLSLYNFNIKTINLSFPKPPPKG